jgi:hypothetical protein
MCYLAREQQAHEPAATAVPSPGPDRVRPRWAGVLAFGVIGGIAMAALVAPSPTAKVPDVQARGAAFPVAAQAATVPAAGTLEKVTLPADDGVPTSTSDTMKAGIGPCHHDL